mmetsp:Transcript_13369/g.24752  ORF Transcript_13369/g.24752 Transcript_13369/m.24752 type:complete len:457 (+) Transcript_13369:120-1490(+)
MNGCFDFLRSCTGAQKGGIIDQIEDAVEEHGAAVHHTVSKAMGDMGLSEHALRAGTEFGAAVGLPGLEGVPESYDDRAALAIPGVVRMISGCHDTQTSADVSNTASFDLPTNVGPGGAGGACTNALVKALHENGDSTLADYTWVQLLDKMRVILKQKGFEQIPQLSSSRKLDIDQGHFSPLNPNGPGRKRAVLIGINYRGQQGELRGCHNDVLVMKQLLHQYGFEESDMKLLMDDDMNINPTTHNILAAMEWLHDGAEPNDSLFLHYSGHGGYVNDASGDEDDNRDETIVPVDFKQSGQIIDDVLFAKVIMPVPEGVMLTCIMDCCHSGTVLDLPYMIKVSDHLEGSGAQMQQNPGFSFEQLLKVAKKLATLKAKGATNSQLMSHAAKEIFPMLMGGGGGGGGSSSSSATSGGVGNLISLMGGPSALMGMAMGGASGGNNNSNGNNNNSNMPALPF